MSSNNDKYESKKRVVTSMYTDLYLEDDYCEFQKPDDIENLKPSVKNPVCKLNQECVKKSNWQSPSDQIIDLVDCLPPYTSRFLRSKTHYGILAQGENLIQEHDLNTFHKNLDLQIKENEAACEGILEHQIKSIMNKVKHDNAVIIANKKKIFLTETSKFYEESLQQLEDHVRSEVQTVLVDLQAKIKRDINTMISNKLNIEKERLDYILKQKKRYELSKIKFYYQLLLKNIIHINNKLKNQALIENNYTLRAFLRQMNMKNITNTMYVLCEERKKCKIRQFLIQKYQTSEISDLKHRLQHRIEMLEDWKIWDTKMSSMKSWEEKITKIVQLFLKFIGFSLKLLPEQVTFLLDLEKMVILQMNELQKSPLTASCILVEDDNIFNFEKTEPMETQCDKKPFEIIGDMSDDVPTRGSSETIPSNENLPFFRVGRQFVYAKCENFEEVKTILKLQPCKCDTKHETEYLEEQERSETNISHEKIEKDQPSLSQNDSSLEHLLIDDIHKLDKCPIKKCNLKKLNNTFSDLNAFLNYTEENLEKLKQITSTLRVSSKVRSKINPADIVFDKLPFDKTNEKFRNTETQYSSQETLTEEISPCPCVDRFASSSANTTDTKKRSISSIMHDRKIMLSKLVHDHPKLHNIIFTEENYDLPF